MTTDDTPFDPESGYLQIPVPGIPYSAVRVPLSGRLDADNLWVEHAMLVAQLASKAYAEAFAVEAPEPHQEAPRRAQSAQSHPRPAQSVRRPAGGLDASLVVHGNCPEHWVPARPSNLQYQEIEIAEDGTERYAKYWHDNPDGSRHSLWARELVPA